MQIQYKFNISHLRTYVSSWLCTVVSNDGMKKLMAYKDKTRKTAWHMYNTMSLLLKYNLSYFLIILIQHIATYLDSTMDFTAIVKDLNL